MEIDRDDEALMRELLAGVAGGWSYGSLNGWLMAKKLKDPELAAWLQENGEELSANAEIRAQLVCLANLNRGDLASVAANLVKGYEPEFDESKEWFDRGNELYELGKYAEAITSYDQVIELNPNFYEAFLNKGNALSKLCQYKAAIASFDTAIELKSDNRYAWCYRGNNFHYMGEDDEAILSFNRAIEISCNYYDAFFNRGTALYKVEQYEEAITNFNRVIEFTPADYRAFFNKGAALERLARYEEALLSFEQAIKLKTDEYLLWYGRGNVFGIVKGCNAEIDAYQQAFNYIQPDTHQKGWGYLQREIGRAHYREGKAQLLNYRTNPQSYYQQSITAYNKALETLTRQQFPELRLETLIDLGQVQLAQHNPTAAHETKIEAFCIFRDLLNAQPTFEAKRRFRLKYTSLRQLDVELFIATGDNILALEAAELDKNERLTLLLAGLEERTISPPYEEMRQLLTSETTGIIYWHLSPDNLTTFLLTAAQPQPLVWNIDNRALQAQQLRGWIKTWDTQYDDYREHKSSRTPPSANGEPTENHKAALPWQKNLTANLMQLKQILDIDNICKQLPANFTNLILIPHGDLHRFPLHILFLTAQKSQILGCTYLPSIQIGLNLRDRSFQSYTPLLSVTDPATEQAPMPFAQLESAIIRQLLQPHTPIDPQSANLATVETALTRPHASFHFTGHAAYNSRKPEDSALALTDAPLTAKHIAQLNLSSYNLITLAACETAITGRTNITTEYVGLTSAFLQAGAANILSTLWQVDEISNAWFTIYFHQQLLAGCSPAFALTITQIWLKTVTWQELANWLTEIKQLPDLNAGIVGDLEDDITIALESGDTMGLDRPTKYSHPYYWAAFTLTGRG